METGPICLLLVKLHFQRVPTRLGWLQWWDISAVKDLLIVHTNRFWTSRYPLKFLFFTGQPGLDPAEQLRLGFSFCLPRPAVLVWTDVASDIFTQADFQGLDSSVVPVDPHLLQSEVIIHLSRR